MKYKFEELVEHLKKYGFFFPNSEIYGGLANNWDYGPLGIEIKIKLKKLWWKHFISNFDFNYGLDSSILMNSMVWKASGHIDNFSDPLVDCKNCKYRFRPDKLIEKKIKIDVSNFDIEKIDKLIIENNIKCPNCNNSNFTNVRKFKLMFQMNNSITEKENNYLYLRPETAQGIFLNFKNVQRVTASKIPFGIGQIGKSFRNEISPNNFIFRTREFEQMELEFFYSKYDKKNWFEFWVNDIYDFLINELNIDKNNIIKKNHTEVELAHYAKKTIDFNYNFPFGEGELWGIADRGDFDLSSHQINSKNDLRYFDQEKKEKYLPYVIEPSVGVDRLILAILCDSYKKETINNKERVILKINNNLAPIEIILLPLFKKPELIEGINKIALILKKKYIININTNGSIGKRYFNSDAIGTPFCLTYDYDSIIDNSVTIRYRDTMVQERIKIIDLEDFFWKKFN